MRNLAYRVARGDKFCQFEIDYRELTCLMVVQNVARCLVLMTNSVLLKTRKDHVQLVVRDTLHWLAGIRHDDGERRRVNAN